jgi:hypothetical protein
VRLFHRSWGDGLRSDAEFYSVFKAQSHAFCDSHSDSAIVYRIPAGRLTFGQLLGLDNLSPNHIGRRTFGIERLFVKSAKPVCDHESQKRLFAVFPGGQFGELWWVQVGAR